MYRSLPLYCGNLANQPCKNFKLSLASEIENAPRRISLQVKLHRKKKLWLKLTCDAVTNTLIEGRISRVWEANSCRALQIQHVGLWNNKQVPKRKLTPHNFSDLFPPKRRTNQKEPVCTKSFALVRLLQLARNAHLCSSYTHSSLAHCH